MTKTERMIIAKRAVDDVGQAEVARRIGRSASAVSQVMSGKYAGDPDTILELIEASFASTTVHCPVMGEVYLADCIEARRRLELPHVPSSGQTADLRRTCPSCHGGKKP